MPQWTYICTDQPGLPDWRYLRRPYVARPCTHGAIDHPQDENGDSFSLDSPSSLLVKACRKRSSAGRHESAHRRRFKATSGPRVVYDRLNPGQTSSMRIPGFCICIWAFHLFFFSFSFSFSPVNREDYREVRGSLTLPPLLPPRVPILKAPDGPSLHLMRDVVHSGPPFLPHSSPV